MSQPTPRDKAQHRAFYEWVKASVPTRYTRSQDFTGLYLQGANIGFSFPMEGVVDLYHTARSYDVHQWIKLDMHNSHLAARKSLKITAEEFKQYQRHRHTLAYRLGFWKANRPELAEYCGITTDIRQLAQLAVILDYQIP